MHLGILAGITVLSALCCRAYRRFSLRRRRSFLCKIALSVLLIELARDLLIAAAGGDLRLYLPLHLCGLAIFIQLAAALHPTEFLYEPLYCLTLPGAVSALLFPNWANLPALHFLTVSSFLIHGLLVLFPLLLLTSGELVPNARRLPGCLALVLAAAAAVHTVNRTLGTNYMFLEGPSPGSPLQFLARLPGRHGYFLGLLGLLLLVWTALYGIPALARCFVCRAEGRGRP